MFSIEIQGLLRTKPTILSFRVVDDGVLSQSLYINLLRCISIWKEKVTHTHNSFQHNRESFVPAIMLVLFESSSGYALFKVLDEGKLETVENIYKEFKTP